MDEQQHHSPFGAPNSNPYAAQPGPGGQAPNPYAAPISDAAPSWETGLDDYLLASPWARLGAVMLDGIVMMLVMFLSARKVSDTKLVMIGNLCFMVGTIFIYTSWMEGAHVWQFVVPVMMSGAGFPFIASPNRSNFTKAVMGQPALESSQATMQAVLSMFSSVAGFT